MTSRTKAIAAIFLLGLLLTTGASADREDDRCRGRGRNRCPPPPSPPPPPPRLPPPPPSPPPPPPRSPPPPPSPPPPSPPPPAPLTCIIRPVRLLVCTPVVRDIRRGVAPVRFPCCTIINGLTDAQARICTCTAAFRGFLGLRIDIPAEVRSLLAFCGKTVAANFTCT